MRIVLTLILISTFVLHSFGSIKTFHKLELIDRSITGTITDKNNKFIKNVKVKAINVLTKKQYKTKTNESGFFKLNLPLGTYTIKFEGNKNFSPKTIKSIEVGLNGGIIYNTSLEFR